MGGPGEGGEGGRAAYGDIDEGFRTESVRGRIDPKGRISVTSFRGLPKPGEVTTEVLGEIQRARAEAQAPLESEEIPRRYRDGIRTYFDQLGQDK